MAQQDPQYRAGSVPVPTGQADYPILKNLLGASAQANMNRIIHMLIVYDQPISVRFISKQNDSFPLRTQSGAPVALKIDDLFAPSMVNIKEIFVTNNSGNTCNFDVIFLPRIT